MIIDALLIGAVLYFHSPRYAAWVVVIIALRRVPWLAARIAADLRLDQYLGLTAYLAHHALPAWDSPRRVMSRSQGADQKKVPPADTCINTGIADTTAIPPADRDITLDQWLVALTLARDERGKDLFTATKIAAVIGGNHNQTMARIKEVRTGQAAQYRTAEGATEPASYPVTKP